MKITLVCLIGFAAVVAVSAAPQYTTKYDNIDLKQILESDRLLNNYFNCLVNKGPCTADGQELKKALPDAIETGCKSCNDKQKKGSDEVIRHIYKHKPEMWKVLTEMYDPERIYIKKYETEAKDLGIAV
uniref:Chemosensory protein 2 n=1 Tax=Cephus cinctus TaxID=211228 RepID=A0A1W6L1C0_CEPCN|nr:chemosensory protein 2 [Cephus cinctus]